MQPTKHDPLPRSHADDVPPVEVDIPAADLPKSPSATPYEFRPTKLIAPTLFAMIVPLLIGVLISWLPPSREMPWRSNIALAFLVTGAVRTVAALRGALGRRRYALPASVGAMAAGTLLATLIIASTLAIGGQGPGPNLLVGAFLYALTAAAFAFPAFKLIAPPRDSVDASWWMMLSFALPALTAVLCTS